MKYGFRTAGYREWTLADAFRSIAVTGYGGVEVCLEHKEARPEELSPRRAGEIADLAGEVCLEIASISYHGDDEADESRARNQRRAVLLARDFGTDVVVLNTRDRDIGREVQQWDALHQALDALLPIAEAEGVLIALEPEPGHFLHSSADMTQLLGERDHPSLKVNLDVGHAFLTDDDLAATIAELGEAIAHTHIEGMSAGVHRHLVPGEGDLDLARVHRALAAVGYSGYYTVDLFNIAHDPEGYARRSLKALRQMLES